MKTLFSELQAANVSEREAEQRLAQEVGQLLGNATDTSLKWPGSTTDLMEATYCAYLSFTLTDENGLCLSFTALVDRVCKVFNVPRPSNPYHLANRGRRRKGLHSQSFLCRYRRRLGHDGHPLQAMIAG